MSNQLAGLLNRVAYYAAALGLAGGVLQQTLYNVDGGERAVIFDRFAGVKEDVIGEGTHLRIPWVQTPHVMDIRTRPRQISSQTGTKDLQVVNISLRVLSKPDTDRLPWIFKQLGLDWDERVLPSIGNEVVKSVVAQYNAEQLLTNREMVSQSVCDILRHRAKDFAIVLDDVAITHLSFSTEFTKAVEAKQVAYQEAERAKFLVMKAQEEKKAAVTRAEGESEAAKLISDATKQAGAGLLELRRIEAAKDVAGVLAKSKNITYLPSGSNQSLLLQVPQQ